MKAIRLALALVAVMAAAACSTDIAGPDIAPSTGSADIVIGSPG